MGAMRPTVLLFDIDGTLVTTGGAGRRSMDLAFERLHRRRDACDSFSMSGMTDRAIVRKALEIIGAPTSTDAITTVQGAPVNPGPPAGAPTASGRGTAATEVAAPRPTTPTLATTAAANPRLDSATTVGRRCAAGAARRGPAPGKGPRGRSPADRLGVMATARTARYDVTRIDSSLWKTPCGPTTRPRLETEGSTPASGRTRA